MNTFIPTKYQSPLIIDTNAIETSQVTFQHFKPIGWRGFQIVQTMSAVQNVQFSQGSPHQIGRKAPHT